MRRASLSFMPLALLAGATVLMLAPAVAGHADDSATAAPAATITVANCNNSGPGSLRAAIASAASGDQIDLAALKCNRIVLTSGTIEVAQNDLELVGRSRWSLTIDGNQAGRVFAHSGTGTLRIRRLSIAYGYFQSVATSDTDFAPGGCIYSAGTLELIGSQVHHCTALHDLTFYARTEAGHSTIIDSTISGNSAFYSSAAYFAGDAAIHNSTITANEITLGLGSGYCEGDGAVLGELQLRLESTIVAGNTCIAPEGPHYDIALT